ncbi:hypothetical protein LC048_21000 [Mesobacillus subterraneus]|uniref:hypothetical protein n=1 Tax=Mesobacillus subterraneus TaxID=285983 RepID=UPI001CFC86BC|nr:hypothetical protein [Mesobacillus subterraneus]WLR54847.1 hypothetical protein LC048_21000 [Mesobacillus subterraneus]
MEKYYLKFKMNNGDEIELEEERNQGHSFIISFEQSGEWYQSGNRIINLSNVNSVEIETEAQRDSRAEDALNMVNSLKY